jgi:hypothetical protein
VWLVGSVRGIVSREKNGSEGVVSMLLQHITASVYCFSILLQYTASGFSILLQYTVA